MEDGFNYNMETRYTLDFKKCLKYERLYEYIRNERQQQKINEDIDDIDVRDLFERRDNSGINRKLKNMCGIDVKSCSTDEERYDALKLMYFLYENGGYKPGTVSILKLLERKSPEHTDSGNSIYKETIEKCLTELRKGVSDPDRIEKTISKVDDGWEYIRTQIRSFFLVEIMNSNTSDIEKISTGLKNLVKSFRNFKSEKSEHKSSVIDAFYSSMLSSNCVFKTGDELATSLLTSSSKPLYTPEIIQQMVMNPLLSEKISWKDFSKHLNLVYIDLKDKTTMLIWTIILGNTLIDEDKVKEIKKSEYNFAYSYSDEVSGLWKSLVGHEELSILEWIIVFQELMAIKKESVIIENKHYRFKGNGKISLTSAIKKLNSKCPNDSITELPKRIIENRLIMRMCMMFGAEKYMNIMRESESSVLELKKINLSFTNVEEILNAHMNMYYYVSALLVSTEDCNMALYSINKKVNKELSNCGFPAVSIINGYTLNDKCIIALLFKDKLYRQGENNTCKNYIITGNIMKFIEESQKVCTSIELLTEALANKIKTFNVLRQNNIEAMLIHDMFDNQLYDVKIFLGDGYNYRIVLRFSLVETNPNLNYKIQHIRTEYVED